MDDGCANYEIRKIKIKKNLTIAVYQSNKFFFSFKECNVESNDDLYKTNKQQLQVFSLKSPFLIIILRLVNP